MNTTDIFTINTQGAKKGIDYEVVSTVDLEERELVYTKNGDQTPIPEHFERAYWVKDHTVDLQLAIDLGMGVIKDEELDEHYLYSIDGDSGDEAVRMSMYYQLTHPEYDDKDLDKMLNAIDMGESYLQTLLVNDSDVIKQLKEIFRAKKGNVIQFK